MHKRWLNYQKERFPVLKHGLLVVVFCLAAMLFPGLQDGNGLPAASRVAAAVISVLILFFQLRVADEFKDFEIDCRYRPHRPVPRGLVSLRELARLAVAGGVVQFVVAVSIDVGLVPILLALWLYAGLMTREFFVRDWLLAHPVAYLFSHMLIMPLIALYASAFDWLCECREMPLGMPWLLLLSFSCGLVLEIGRKIRLPADERAGVETYSALWGGKVAVSAWFAALGLSVFAYAMAASHLGPGYLALVPGVLVMAAGLYSVWAFPGPRRDRAGQLIEPVSGVAALILYAGLGPLQAIFV